MEMNSLGMHLLLVPDGESVHIPRVVRAEISSCINVVGALCDVSVKERAVREDHIHVLVEITNEEHAAQFIARLVEKVTETVAEFQPMFEISEKIHVTLLPSHHREIMSSFLRDQDRYHSERTVQEEIDQVFRPDKMRAVAN